MIMLIIAEEIFRYLFYKSSIYHQMYFLFHLYSVIQIFCVCSGEVSSVFTTERVLSGVHYFRCRDYVELLATIHLLTDFIKDYPKVRDFIVTKRLFLFLVFIFLIQIFIFFLFLLLGWG